MKVIVFGATGTVGRLAIDNLLSNGHTVTAFARNPDNLKNQSTSLLRVSGDAMDAETVSKAIAGHDAVYVMLGAGKSRRSLIRSQGTLNVIRGMQTQGVRRLVCQSTLGAHESWGNLNFLWKRIMFGVLLRPVFKDHELQEKLVQASGLDWTIVRPSAFTDGPATGTYKEAFGPDERNLSLKITRADLAAFLAEQLSGLTYLQRAVSLSN